MSAPAITVLLPVFNGGALLLQSLESILAQSWRDLELLVIDDGSTDDTPKLLRAVADPRLRTITNERNLGLTRSLNRGLAEARGEFIARQDADDLSATSRLEKQLAFLRENPEVQLLGTSAWRISPEGRITGTNDLPTTHEAIRWASITDNPFLHTSVMFRRDFVLREFGGYDEQFSICQDFALWNRIAAQHRTANLRERLVRMREHPASMTRTQSAATTDEVRRILEENWRSVFPERSFSPSEKELLEKVRLRFPPEQLAPLRTLLDELAADFLQLHPTARCSADFHATRCRQALRLGYKFLGTDRAAAAGELSRAFRISPHEWLRQGWSTLHAVPVIGSLTRAIRS